MNNPYHLIANKNQSNRVWVLISIQGLVWNVIIYNDMFRPGGWYVETADILMRFLPKFP